MKKRLMAMILMVGLLLPVGAGATPRADDPANLRTLTRGGFVQLLAEASGEELTAYADMNIPFADVEEDNSFVRWAYAKWIVNGDSDSSFRPNEPITREQAAAMLGRYLDYRYTAMPAGCGTGAPSMDNIAAWAQDGVMKCWMYGVIDTHDAPAFWPKVYLTGAEGAQWVKNANALTVGAISAPEKPTFADDLVHKVDQRGNYMLSPYSARLCLAMLANGAKGETQQEILTALQIDNLAAFNQSVKAQLETYDKYARVMDLDTANSIWLNQSSFDGKAAFAPAFTSTLKDAYRAEVKEMTDENSVELINSWVNEKTKGKIPEIMTEENRQSLTALINAVYFKAAWQHRFSDGLTDKADFTNADGTVSQVDMMHQTENFGYYATPGVEALKLNYRNYAVDNEDGENFEHFRDADFSMYLIKADAELNVQHLLDNATFTEGLVNVSVPKFEIGYGRPLNAALRSMGIQTAYQSGKADLSAMVDPVSIGGIKLNLVTVVQRTFISVDEEGTEAAAVTAAFSGAGAAMPERPELVRDFTADSPFWFAIRDNANGEILFVGRYETAA